VRSLAAILAAFALSTAACSKKVIAPGPPSVYQNWKGSRFSLRVEFERYLLDNGLEVVLNEDHRQPVVTLQLEYGVGRMHDPPNAEGLAHLTEHLMFHGSRHVGAGKFHPSLERAGATSINGLTYPEKTVYFETLPARQLELALWLESDRMAFPFDHVDATSFDIERRVVANEMRERNERPLGDVGSLIAARLFPSGHPFYPRKETPESLAQLSMAGVRQFWRAYYRPNNATLYLGGDFQLDTAKRLIEQYFGPIVPGAVPSRSSIPDVPSIDTSKRLEIEADVPIGRMMMDWITPAFGEPGDADLDAIADMLDQRWMGPALVHDQRIALEFDARQSSSRWSSIFQISFSVRSGVDFEEAIAAVDDSLTKFATGWRQPSMIRSATFPLLLRLAQTQEQPASRISYMASNTFDTGDPNFIERDAARYESITPESIMRTAQKFLALDRRLITIVRPVREAPPGGRLARQP
jgi:predicted Zn-dependent peptidase